jgi:hypothetical protein
VRGAHSAGIGRTRVGPAHPAACAVRILQRPAGPCGRAARARSVRKITRLPRTRRKPLSHNDSGTTCAAQPPLRLSGFEFSINPIESSRISRDLGGAGNLSLPRTMGPRPCNATRSRWPARNVMAQPRGYPLPLEALCGHRTCWRRESLDDPCRRRRLVVPWAPAVPRHDDEPRTPKDPVGSRAQAVDAGGSNHWEMETIRGEMEVNTEHWVIRLDHVGREAGQRSRFSMQH